MLSVFHIFTNQKNVQNQGSVIPTQPNYLPERSIHGKKKCAFKCIPQLQEGILVFTNKNKSFYTYTRKCKMNLIQTIYGYT